MKEIIDNKTSLDYSIVKVLIGTFLVLLMLISTVGAEPFAYIRNSDSNNVSIIDTAINTNESNVPVETGLFLTAFSPDGSKVYVVNNGSNNISVINTATNVTTAVLTAGNGTSGIVISQDGTKLYVTDSKDNTTSAINTTDNTLLATVNLGWEPAGIGITPDGKTVYIASNDSKNVSVIDTANYTVMATIPVETIESAIVEVAKNWIGVSNVHGGNNTSAIDCSHLVYQVYRQVGVKGIIFQTVPNMKSNTYYVNTTSPKPGDVVFWEKDVAQNNRTYWLATHVGIYTGNEQFIHTSYDTGKVSEDNITGIYKEGVPYFARWSNV